MVLRVRLSPRTPTTGGAPTISTSAGRTCAFSEFRLFRVVLRGAYKEGRRKCVARDPELTVARGLGIAYAGLGRKNDAIREGELAAKLAPISQDAFSNTDITTLLAQIYVMVGEYEDAIDQLEYLLSIPALLSTPSLRVDPTWAPLREHPGFEALLKKYAVKVP